MKKPSKGRSDDLNILARSIVSRATGEVTPQESEATVRGRKAGTKGGKARADALSKDERSEIAKKAAAARWRRTHEPDK